MDTEIRISTHPGTQPPFDRRHCHKIIGENINAARDRDDIGSGETRAHDGRARALGDSTFARQDRLKRAHAAGNENRRHIETMFVE